VGFDISHMQTTDPVRLLVNTSEVSHDRAEFEGHEGTLDRETMKPGQPSLLRARLLGSNGAPLPGESVTVAVEGHSLRAGFVAEPERASRRFRR
jgi:hypothetical protein